MARIEIRRILCPTDFSAFADRALSHAIALARWYEARLTVLHVLPPPPAPGSPFQAFAPPPPDTAAEGRVLQSLARFTRPAEEAGVPIDVQLREGSPARTVLDLARTLPSDLIVMGTHGREGFERLVLGSVTEKVVRQAPCPVLTVPPASEGSAAPLFRRILCPVDFSPASDRAVAYALSLAQEAGATLRLLHVVEWGIDPVFAGVPQYDAPEVRQAVESDLRRRLGGVIPREAREWCQVDEVLTSGKPWREIVAAASEGRADLVVMGVRGRGSLEVALFGSNTHHVVRSAPCPVLAVREAAPAVAAVA
jgi:nucleotide-binding universal stress UspA family protein